MAIFKKKPTEKSKATEAKKADAAPVVEHPHIKYDKLETIDGTYKTIIPDRIKNKPKWERPDPRKILSFIPGTITSIDVKIGDTVKEDETLLTFKAMKMLNTYHSPLEGKIAAIHVAVGDIVSKGTLLLEFE